MFATHNGYKITIILVSTSSKPVLQERKLSFERKTNQKVCVKLQRSFKSVSAYEHRIEERAPHKQVTNNLSPFVGKFNDH